MWKADKICGRLKSVAPFKIQINWPAIRRVHLFRYHFLMNIIWNLMLNVYSINSRRKSGTLRCTKRITKV